MFAGKSSTLIHRVERAVIAKQNVLVFKPSIDTRYGIDNIKSHSQMDLEIRTGVKPKSIENSFDILKTDEYQLASLIVFDEIQFFEKFSTLSVIHELLNNNKKIICAGLDLDSFGNPFGVMPDLLALADEVIKLKSVCIICQKDATRTFRKSLTNEQVMVGNDSLYEPRCYECWKSGNNSLLSK